MATSKTEARKRARAAKARVDARRAKRDADISKVQTDFFLASAERDAAREAVLSAEADMAGAVSNLSERLDVRVEEIAELCEISTAEVRAFKKREKHVEASARASAAEDQEIATPDTAGAAR